MDTLLAIASKREVRDYADRPLPEEVVERILAAGRVTGSAMNAQPWRFVLLASSELRAAVAETVYAPANLTGAATAVAILVRGGRTADFDAGRAAQSMMLAASNDGVGSSPNGVRDRERFAALVGAGEEERAAIVLSFGYPARPRRAEDRSAEDWMASARRKPVEEVVTRLDTPADR
jgi:nitroreductase